jgi:DNA topoisomerase VI subunit B
MTILRAFNTRFKIYRPCTSFSFVMSLHDTCLPKLEQPVPSSSDPRTIIREFKNTINMSPSELERFLDSQESREAVEGEHISEIEHNGRHFARRVIELLTKDQDRGREGADELMYEQDIQNMFQISEYIKCHTSSGQGLSPSAALRLKCFGFDVAKQSDTQCPV